MSSTVAIKETFAVCQSCKKEHAISIEMIKQKNVACKDCGAALVKDGKAFLVQR